MTEASTKPSTASPTSPATSDPRSDGVVLFFVLACTITWLATIPIVRATLTGAQPTALALALAAASAFGPTLAAAIVAGGRGELSSVFGFRPTPVVWVLVGLAAVPLTQLVATLVEVALGGEPAAWFYPPIKPEHVAAMVLFSVGEEYGWRGFAYPRLAGRLGAVRASMILGAVWTAWHVTMWITPAGPPTWLEMATRLVYFSAASILMAWVFERGKRSMAVAFALHASGHLDNVFRAPASETRLRVLRLVVLVVVAGIAARSLAKRAR